MLHVMNFHPVTSSLISLRKTIHCPIPQPVEKCGQQKFQLCVDIFSKGGVHIPGVFHWLVFVDPVIGADSSIIGEVEVADMVTLKNSLCCSGIVCTLNGWAEQSQRWWHCPTMTWPFFWSWLVWLFWKRVMWWTQMLSCGAVSQWGSFLCAPLLRCEACTTMKKLMCMHCHNIPAAHESHWGVKHVQQWKDSHSCTTATFWLLTNDRMNDIARHLNCHWMHNFVQWTISSTDPTVLTFHSWTQSQCLNVCGKWF